MDRHNIIFKRAWLSSRAALLLAAFSRRPRHQIHISWIKGTRILGPAGSCFSRPAKRPIPTSPLRREKMEGCFCSIPPTWGSPQIRRRRQARRRRSTRNRSTLAGVDRPFSSDRMGVRLVTSHGSTLRTWQVQMSPRRRWRKRRQRRLVPGKMLGFSRQFRPTARAGGSAIIWAVGRPTGTGADPTAVNLYAFAATPSSGSTTLAQLFSAKAGSWPNTGGNANIVPVVANGKVFVASAYRTDRETRADSSIFSERAAPARRSPALRSSAGAQPANGHMISGTLTAVNGETLTLRTRAGKTTTIDASGALQNEKVTGPLNLGTPFTAQGMTFDASGALLATAIGSG